jgi:hypothetical protein
VGAYYSTRLGQAGGISGPPRAYTSVVAMGETSIFQWIANLILYIAIDPANKLSFYRDQSQQKYDIAKGIFIEAVS